MSSRLVMCQKYGKELPGLDSPPMPGPTGVEIFETISAKAWQEWTNLQTMLINEKHLSLRDPSTRRYLNEQRTKFLSNADWERPEGFVPES